MKNTTKILSCFLIFILFSWITIYSQEQEKHELSVSVGGGVSTLLYKLNTGDYKPGFGGVVNIGYGYFFNDNFGITTGVEFGSYNAKSTFDYFYGFMPVEHSFDYRYKVNDYSEKQKLIMFNIPLMFQFQYPLFFEDHFCYVALGGRVGFPAYNDSFYKTSETEYVPYIGDVMQDDQILKTEGRRERLSFLASYMVSIELGMKWNTSRLFSLYTGIYCDYGINDIAKYGHGHFLKYDSDNPSNSSNYGTMYSYFIRGNERVNFVNEIHPLAVGLKVRLAFRIPESCIR